MGVGQQFGRIRKRDWPDKTGRAGHSEDGWRLAFLFRMAGSLSVAVPSTAGMSSPGKAKWDKYTKPDRGVKRNNASAVLRAK